MSPIKPSPLKASVLALFAVASVSTLSMAYADEAPKSCPADQGTCEAKESTEATPATETEAVETEAAEEAAEATEEAEPAAPTPAELYTKAQEYESQAEIAYPKAFYDRELWKKAVDSAYGAQQGEPSNPEYQKYLAQLYTTTGWWIKAYESWQQVQDMNDKDKEQASMTARKLAYSAWKRGDRVSARNIAQRGLAWKEDAQLRSLLQKL